MQQETEFVGELNLKKQQLIFPPELGLAGRKVFYDLAHGRVDVYPRSFHNPTAIVGDDNVLDIKYVEPFKVHLGLSYGRKYPLLFTKSSEMFLGKKVSVFKGNIQL